MPLAATLERGFLRRAHALPEQTQQLLLLAAAADSSDLQDLVAACALAGVGEKELSARHGPSMTVRSGHERRNLAGTAI